MILETDIIYLEQYKCLQLCTADLVNTEAALIRDPLLQGAFACEISGI